MALNDDRVMLSPKEVENLCAVHISSYRCPADVAKTGRATLLSFSQLHFALGAVPFRSPWWRLQESDAFKMEPFPFAL